jgi:endonuclease/exonuclease/phosphatase family metal-dependent hydrolase
MSRRAIPSLALFLGFASLNCSAADTGDSDHSEDAVIGAETCGEGECVRSAGPEELTYEELVTLSKIDGRREGARYVLKNAPAGLEDKLNALVDTPFVNNDAFYSGAKKYMPTDPKLGPTLRAAMWNIERGQQLPNILAAIKAADDPSARAAFTAGLRKGTDLDEIDRQLDALAKTDLFILNEVDRGMRRSGYEDVVARLGKELKMNWAYATEFVEIDPVALGTEKYEPGDFATIDLKTQQPTGAETPEQLEARRFEVSKSAEVDPKRVRAMHGNAVLSRYPILKAEAHPLHTVCWDWNFEEKKKLNIADALIKKGMNFAAEKVFLEKTMREVRHAGRTALVVDLKVNGLDVAGTKQNVVTVLDFHAEAKSTPQCRAQQVREALDLVKDRTNPVIFAGDLNTFGGDGRPMTVAKLLKSRFGNPEWIAKQLVTRFVPYSSWAFNARDALNWIRLKDDPTGIDIPFLLPNKERGLFSAVEDTKFADGARFDFRGDELRTVNGTAKTLANSNQRDGKGFKTTSALERTIGGVFGRWKIDWMFVRGYAKDPRSGKASYRMAPHFSRTLEELRDATPERLSDHAPITVVLPLKDPCLGKSASCVVDDSEAAGDDGPSFDEVYEQK